MAISAGDVTFEFLGNTQNLDQAFNQVGPKAKAAFVPATAAVEDLTKEMAVGQAGAVELGEVMTLSGEKARESMYQARGEAGLLGEAFGVHLPRHVRSFVAELPGVGQALSAAFSATAILFVVQALFELSKKLSEALAQFVYAKSVWEESNASVIALNGELITLSKQYEELKRKADDYGKTAMQLATEHKGEVKQSITELTKELHEEEEQIHKLNAAGVQHISMWAAFKQGMSGLAGGAAGLAASMSAAYTEYKRNNDGVKELGETQNKMLTTAARLKNAQQELRIATNGVSTAQADLTKKGEALEEQISRTANEINKLNIQLNHTKAEASDVEIITPAHIQNMLKGIAAAHEFGIVLRSDLVAALNAAKKAEADFAASGIQDSIARKAVAAEVDKARAALERYGQAEDRFKLKSHGMWKEFRQDAKDGATTMDQVRQLGVTAFDELTKGLEQSIQAAILSQGTFAQAMEKATASALASIASQAIVKSLFYTGEGVASVFTDPPAAAAFFEAAGIMAAVGAAAGITAHAMSGGGGGSSSSSTQQGNNSVSNTGNQPGRSGSPIGVQAFAEGGLVMGPTLALIGERGREAVIPLDNPNAKKQIGDGVGGGTHFNIHVAGMISPDNLTKVVKKISDGVMKNRFHLHASNSLRVTKRSA